MGHHPGLGRGNTPTGFANRDANGFANPVANGLTHRVSDTVTSRVTVRASLAGLVVGSD